MSSGTSKVSKEELNQLSAKLLKAEMSGKTDLVAKIRQKIADLKEGKIAPSNESGDILLTRTDFRTGLTMPVRGGKRKATDLKEEISDRQRDEFLANRESLKDLVRNIFKWMGVGVAAHCRSLDFNPSYLEL